MQTINIATSQEKQILDITDIVHRWLKNHELMNGLCHLFIKHTTAALATADLDAGGTDRDYLDAFEAIMPKLNYRHPHNPAHVVDHILASIIGPSLTVPVKEGNLDLGQWQRIVLIELDGPRDREIVITAVNN
jgi:secondary thiamine-phosphate synthase enzyme